MRLTHLGMLVLVLYHAGLSFVYTLLGSETNLFGEWMVLVANDLFQILVIAFYDCLKMSYLEMISQKYLI
jgi:hypothetical protein